MHNKTLETNCRPASPLDAWWQFGRTVDAQPCVSGGSRSALRWSRHEVAFNTAWLDRFPDQALRVAAGIPRKRASGGLGRVATTTRGMEPSRQCSKPGSLRPGAS